MGDTCSNDLQEGIEELNEGGIQDHRGLDLFTSIALPWSRDREETVSSSAQIIVESYRTILLASL